jgi:hypothetical protein
LVILRLLARLDVFRSFVGEGRVSLCGAFPDLRCDRVRWGAVVGRVKGRYSRGFHRDDPTPAEPAGRESG